MTAARPGWVTRPLGELVTVLDHMRIPVSVKERSGRPGPVPYFGAVGQVGWIDRPVFDEPLVLLGEDGVQFLDQAKPKAYLVDGPAWVNNHAHVLRPRAAIDQRFLKYYLDQFDYRGFANGTTRLKLTQSAMRRMPVLLPPVDEQRRIVAILEDHLSRLDAGDVNLDHARRRLQLLDALSFERSREGALVTLGQLATHANYGTSTKCVIDGHGAPVVRIPNLRAGRIDLAHEKRAADPAVDLQSVMTEPGDVLIIRTNGSRALIGRSAVVQPSLRVAFASYLIRFRFDPSRIRPEWVRMMLETPTCRTQLESLAASSAGQYNLGLKKLEGVSIPLPTLDRQDELIVSKDTFDAEAEAVRSSLRTGCGRSAALRRSLLAAAFSGRLTGHASDMDRVDELAAT